MSKILVGIPYLEGQDINQDGSLNVLKGKPVVMMVQGLFCTYCTKAKPDFQKFAQSTPGVQACTVQTDGGPSDKEAAEKLRKTVNKSQGVPAYLGFNAQGKFVSIHSGGRDVASLQAFAKSL